MTIGKLKELLNNTKLADTDPVYLAVPPFGLGNNFMHDIKSVSTCHVPGITPRYLEIVGMDGFNW